MSENSLTIRLYSKGDEFGIVKLFKDVFGREMTLDEWRWKYIESYPDKVYSSVAIHKDMGIVGHYGGVRLPLIYKGNPAHGLAICDVMIYQKFRGIKTLKELSGLVPREAVKDGIIMGYGFPNRATLLTPALSLGIFEKVEDVLEGNKDVKFHNDSIRYKFKLFPVDYSDIMIDRLWESCKTDLYLAVVRDGRYLTWRYKNHPLFSYELWGLKNRMGRRLLGLAVLKREEHRVLIMDFLFAKGLLKPLFKKLENYIHSIGGKNIILWASPFMEKALSESGFSIKTAETAIPRTTHENTLTKDEMGGKFFYTMGDTDFL